MRKRRRSPVVHRWTKDALLAELRRRHRAGQPIATDKRFYASIYRQFGSLGAAADLVGIRVRRLRRRSRRELLDDLRELAKEHEVITWEIMIAAGLRRAVLRHFGALSAACASAGVEFTARRREKMRAKSDRRAALIDSLRGIARSLQRPVRTRDLPRTLLEALLRRFGTLAAARRAAGLPQPQAKELWTDERLRSAIRKEHARGTRITEMGLRVVGRTDLAEAIKRKLRSFVRARKLAGVTNPPIEREHPPFAKLWDRERVLAEIRERAAKRQPLALTKTPRPLVAAAARYCGSWSDAIEAAGLRYETVRIGQLYDDAELLRRVRALAKREPNMTLKELRRIALGALLYVRFGSPEQAAVRAGLRGWPVRQTYPAMPPMQARAALLARLARGKSIARTHVLRDDGHLAHSVSRIDPSWARALRKLRVAPRLRA